MSRKPPRRRSPTQRRARATVAAVLDAVARVLKREGAGRVTTNRIAEAAGVSVGSLYQYFADKRAILQALRDRHVAEMGRLIERRLVEHAQDPLDGLMRALVEALIEAHALDPALYALLLSHVPPGADEDATSGGSLGGALRLALASRTNEVDISEHQDGVLFVLAQMMEALAHGAVLQRPPSLSLHAAKEEAVRAVIGYLGSYRTARPASPRGSRKKARQPSAGRSRSSKLVK